jgi:hypothetical protein
MWLADEMRLADGECVQVAVHREVFLKLRGGAWIIIIIITLNDTMAALATIGYPVIWIMVNKDQEEYRSTASVFFSSGSRTSMFFLNVQTYIPDRTVSQPRGLQYEPSPPWKHQTLHKNDETMTIMMMMKMTVRTVRMIWWWDGWNFNSAWMNSKYVKIEF